MDGIFRSRKTNLLLRTAASLVLAASALSLAAPAQAGDPAVEFAAGSATVQAAEAISRGYWQTTPCAGQASLVWMRLGDVTNATSTWTNPVGQYDAPEKNASCQITFNSALAWNWTRFCSILVHEYGHLTGHAHIDDAADVMYAYYETPVARCKAAVPSASAVPVTAAIAEPVAALPVPEAAAPAHPRAITSNRATKKPAHHHRQQRGHRGKRVGRLVRVA